VILKSALVNLRIEGETSTYSFEYSQNGDDFKQIQKIASCYLSTEIVGGFTGVYVGFYATENGKPLQAKR